jgi:hypothetical protein
MKDGIGFILLMVGGCTIGSASVIPAVMVITGLAILAISARKEKRDCHRPKRKSLRKQH